LCSAALLFDIATLLGDLAQLVVLNGIKTCLAAAV